MSPAALDRLSMLPLVVGAVDGVLGSEPEVTLVLPSSTSLWSPGRGREPVEGTVNGMVRMLKIYKDKQPIRAKNANNQSVCGIMRIQV